MKQILSIPTKLLGIIWAIDLNHFFLHILYLTKISKYLSYTFDFHIIYSIHILNLTYSVHSLGSS